MRHFAWKVSEGTAVTFVIAIVLTTQPQENILGNWGVLTALPLLNIAPFRALLNSNIFFKKFCRQVHLNKDNKLN